MEVAAKLFAGYVLRIVPIHLPPFLPLQFAPHLQYEREREKES